MLQAYSEQEIGALAISLTIYLSTRVLQTIWSAIKKDRDVGKGCTDITRLTDEAEKKKKSDQTREKPGPEESWWVAYQALVLHELQAGKGIYITELCGVLATASVLSPTNA